MNANELRNIIAFRERQRDAEKDPVRRERLTKRIRELRKELRTSKRGSA